MNTITRFMRPLDVAKAFGISKSQYYLQRADGLLPSPIAVGKRAQAHPEREIAAVQAAVVRGVADDDRRALVRELEAARAAA